jgi:Fe-S oxidoreductase
MWMREIRGQKINEVRVKELIKGQPEIIVTSCPYCLVMLGDAIGFLRIEGVECLDLTEIIRKAI